MRKPLAIIAVTALVGCAGRGEIIPTPSPAPDPASTSTTNYLAAAGPDSTTEVILPAPELPEAAQAPAEVVADTTIPVTTIKRSTTTTTIEEIIEHIYPGSSELASIRECESRNDYSTNTGNGYYGAYQFHPNTWASVGGTGNPAHASAAEQDMRAQMMIDAGRRGEWPNC